VPGMGMLVLPRLVAQRSWPAVSVQVSLCDICPLISVLWHLFFPLGRGECEKGIWWMPWRREAMKDVARCDKPWGAASRL
jgi:hypothetical protein